MPLYSYSHHEVRAGNWFLSTLFTIISYTHNVAQKMSVLFSFNWNYSPIDSLFPSSLNSGSPQPIFWFYKFTYLILSHGSRLTQWVSYVNSLFHLAQCSSYCCILKKVLLNEEHSVLGTLFLLAIFYADRWGCCHILAVVSSAIINVLF